MIGPCYWMHETSGVLRPVILKYLDCAAPDLTPEECAIMRACLRQWIEPDVWAGPDIQTLRDAIGGLTTEAAIDEWCRKALEENIDPF
jgi:hypothetical protein